MPPGVVAQTPAGNNEAWLAGQAAAISNNGSIVVAMRTDNKALLANTYLQAFPSQVKPASFGQTAVTSALILNQKSQVLDEAMQIARLIVSPERYPAQLEKAGSTWFPIMKSYLELPFFTQDTWNKEVTQNIVPWTLPATADTGLTPIYDDIVLASTNDMLQAIVVEGKSVEDGLKIMANAAAAAKIKFKM
jgi:ABC-type glycerol-3-phosphate transport system substrate-binding protein